MEFSFHEGDHVLTFNWVGVKEDDVVVFKHSFKHSYVMMIKRIDKIKGDRVYVSGDNKKMSSKVPPTNIGQIIGKVILKY